MENDISDCRDNCCWIPSLIEKGYKSLWPLLLSPERKSRFFEWTFYVKWNETQGTHVNKVRLCEMHHEQILKIYESEMESGVCEQEATQSWMQLVSNQIFRSRC